jgi:hypothetical protein
MDELSWDECSKCRLPSIPKKVLVIEDKKRLRWMLAYKLSNGNCRKKGRAINKLLKHYVVPSPEAIWNPSIVRDCKFVSVWGTCAMPVI